MVALGDSRFPLRVIRIDFARPGYVSWSQYLTVLSLRSAPSTLQMHICVWRAPASPRSGEMEVALSTASIMISMREHCHNGRQETPRCSTFPAFSNATRRCVSKTPALLPGFCISWIASTVLVRVAPEFIARSGLMSDRPALAHLWGRKAGLAQLIIGSIPPVMASTTAHLMLRRCGHLHRRPGNQQRAENTESCFLHLDLRWRTLPAWQQRLAWCVWYFGK